MIPSADGGQQRRVGGFRDQIDRAVLLDLSLVQPQGVVDGCFLQRREVEQAADREAAPDCVARQPQCLLPFVGQQHPDQMPARRVTADMDASRVIPILVRVPDEPCHAGSDLPHDLADAHGWSQRVIDACDSNAGFHKTWRDEGIGILG